MSSQQRINEFIRLFTRYEPRLHSYVMSLIPKWSDAEEVLQEINAILWKKFDDFEPGSNFFAWACKIARFEVLRYRRSQQRDRLRFGEEFIEMVASESENMADELDLRQQALIECLAKLPPADHDLIHHRYQQGISTKEVAKQAGRSVDAIYKSMTRIRKVLFRCVQKALAKQ